MKAIVLTLLFFISVGYAAAQGTPTLGTGAVDSSVFLKNNPTGNAPVPELKNYDKQSPAPNDGNLKPAPQPELAPISKPKED